MGNMPFKVKAPPKSSMPKHQLRKHERLKEPMRDCLSDDEFQQEPDCLSDDDTSYRGKGDCRAFVEEEGNCNSLFSSSLPPKRERGGRLRQFHWFNRFIKSEEPTVEFLPDCPAPMTIRAALKKYGDIFSLNEANIFRQDENMAYELLWFVHLRHRREFHQKQMKQPRNGTRSPECEYWLANGDPYRADAAEKAAK